MSQRIYFDNAATSFPKPELVWKTLDHYSRHIGASAGRGAYREAMDSGVIIQTCRERIATLISADKPENIIMTFNCTDGLALVIKGIVTKPGSHVITTCMDHNSVLRPLYALSQQLDVDVTYIKADQFGMCDPEDIRKAIKPNTALIACVHGSNVCGSVQDVNAVGVIAKEHDIPYLVDAAQTIGHYPVNVNDMAVDFLAFPGHKGLMGPLGTGALYIRPGMEEILRPLKEGGTGSRSEDPFQPEEMPDKFESGSHNALGIAGLSEGVAWILDQGIDKLREHDIAVCQEFLTLADSVDGLSVYGPRDLEQRVSVFSVSIEGYDPQALAGMLEERHGLLTRPGLHCAPYAHQAIGSFDLGGTTRFSGGPFNTINDASVATRALTEIAEAAYQY